ncbi:hypothetical protein GLAREA_10976 [Glarea lozoyensis ATCC 20868]|uniref:Uncharacterized protein n=1 Tax=Glarea lozoyensis (strain ATCC 20868 / MF5171) TaxID=1116229 RepID=S3DA19_GLAL2|nr:uncharacterized protein GLAREA_10976 [Glarea lozoyensis ATCC 20868]EPE35277.1 hypothetical protein GLAREA_10976 [Glarea lozoyensis ATCC 20868]
MSMQISPTTHPTDAPSPTPTYNEYTPPPGLHSRSGQREKLQKKRRHNSKSSALSQELFATVSQEEHDRTTQKLESTSKTASELTRVAEFTVDALQISNSLLSEAASALQHKQNLITDTVAAWDEYRDVHSKEYTAEEHEDTWDDLASALHALAATYDDDVRDLSILQANADSFRDILSFEGNEHLQNKLTTTQDGIAERIDRMEAMLSEDGELRTMSRIVSDL